MKRITLIFLVTLISQLSFSITQVDTVLVFSPKMKKEVKSVVILPENYTKKKHYPVVYLLHGYSDNSTKWVKTVPSIKSLSTSHQLIIVCPDGGYSSWYFDSPIDSSYQYETYITKDLIGYVDSHYSTVTDKSGRAITGLSMGGHGALYLAIRHRDLFAHAGSMSGGVDLLGSKRKFDIAKRIGDYESHPEEWNSRSVVNMVDSLKNSELDLIIDCGVSDFFYEINQNLHRKLLSLKIDHDFTERPGAHNWNYWTNAIEYQLLYFDKSFRK
jgi:S-formylglutathione hydrolase FrmB